MFFLKILIFLINLILVIQQDTPLCRVKNCKTCALGNSNYCEVCRENFYSMNGSCPCRQNSCESCRSSYYGGCNKCKEGFQLRSSQCDCKILNCLFCNENGCDQCLPGYKLEASICVKDLSTIIRCQDANCRYCNGSIEGQCVQCNPGYSLLNGKCTKNPDCLNIPVFGSCSECPEGYYPNESHCEKKCLGQSCEKLTCENICLVCQLDQLMQYTDCHPKNYCKDPNCENCISKKDGDCFRCRLGYRLSQGNCVKCKDLNCLACDYDENICSSCQDSYALIKGECVSKQLSIDNGNTLNCKSHLNQDYCKECDNNYSCSNGNCKSCNIPNCKNCIESDKCFLCKSGYLVDSNYQCKEISCSLNHCLSCSADQKCNECEEGFELKGNRCQIRQCETAHCSNCFYDRSACTQCDAQYYLTEDLKCNNCHVENCKLCNGSTCFSCIDNYRLNMDGLCYYSRKINELIPHCLLYETNGTCKKCDTTCSISDDGNCKCISITAIVVSLLFVVVIIAAIAICCLFSKKRKELQQLQQIAQIERDNRLVEMRIIEMQKIPEDEIAKISKLDLTIPKCVWCLNESGTILLSCGCLLCQGQGKEYLEIENNMKAKIAEDKTVDNYDVNKTCPVCKKIFVTAKQLYSQCAICLEATTKPYHFNCNCALKVCVKCFNRCIDTKKCPGCRKDLIQPSNNPPVNNPNNNNNNIHSQEQIEPQVMHLQSIPNLEQQIANTTNEPIVQLTEPQLELIQLPIQIYPQGQSQTQPQPQSQMEPSNSNNNRIEPHGLSSQPVITQLSTSLPRP